MTNKPELIIFDCDGVLVDSEIIFNEVMLAYLGEFGFRATLQESMDMFVGGSMEGVQAIVEQHGVDLPYGWIDTLYARVMTRLEQGVDAVDGIPEMLERLKSLGVPFCVASNGPVHKMQLTLGQTGLLPFFENALFSAYDINSWKPDPDLFLHAAKHFSTAPESCIVIEDSGTGTLAAKNARIPCLGYAPKGNSESLEANDAKCFRHMNEVLSMLNLA